MSGIATESRWPLGADAGSEFNRYVSNRWFYVPNQQQQQHQQQQYITTPTAIITASFDVTDNKTEATTNLTYNNKRIYRMNDIFHREDERLKTFDMWPLEWMDKCSLAQTGMFYTGESDKVKCYFCEVEIGRWEETDHPVSEHMKWSPNCPLLRRRTTNNVPICAEALHRVLPPQSYDICGAYDNIEIRPYAYAEGSIVTPARMVQTTTTATSSSSSSSSSSIAGTTAAAPPPTPAYYPEYPEYAIETARCRSFSDWPRTMKQKPDQLSEAGFFYTGVGDRVKCFSCGGGLKDWDESDEPWEQHALWLSKCRYLKLIKGQAYVDAVITKYKSNDNNGGNAQEFPTTAAVVGDPDFKTSSSAVCSTQTEDDVVVPQHHHQHPAPAAGNNSNCDENSINTVVVSMHSSPALHAEKCRSAIVTAEASNAAAEKKSIPEEKLCKICYAGEYNTAFLPCGHVVACAKCASSVTKCPLCRKPFTDVMRVYFS